MKPQIERLLIPDEQNTAPAFVFPGLILAIPMRRRCETIGRMNERDFPHLIVLGNGDICRAAIRVRNERQAG